MSLDIWNAFNSLGWVVVHEALEAWASHHTSSGPCIRISGKGFCTCVKMTRRSYGHGRGVKDSVPPADSGCEWTRLLIPAALLSQWVDRSYGEVTFRLT